MISISMISTKIYFRFDDERIQNKRKRNMSADTTKTTATFTFDSDYIANLEGQFCFNHPYIILLVTLWMFDVPTVGWV